METRNFPKVHPLNKFQMPKISSYYPFKTSQKPKPPSGKRIYISSYFKAKNIPKTAEVKLSSCGLEVADFRKNCDCGIAELRLRSNISLKVAELRLRKCFLQVAELRFCGLKKKVARAHLCISVITAANRDIGRGVGGYIMHADVTGQVKVNENEREI
jgi:hypothetical protein